MSATELSCRSHSDDTFKPIAFSLSPKSHVNGTKTYTHIIVHRPSYRYPTTAKKLLKKRTSIPKSVD